MENKINKDFIIIAEEKLFFELNKQEKDLLNLAKEVKSRNSIYYFHGSTGPSATPGGP